MQSKIDNANKNISYCQWYDVKKSLPQIGNNEMKIYKYILARQSGMDYCEGIFFQKGLVNMYKSNVLTNNNQLK